VKRHRVDPDRQGIFRTSSSKTIPTRRSTAHCPRAARAAHEVGELVGNVTLRAPSTEQRPERCDEGPNASGPPMACDHARFPAHLLVERMALWFKESTKQANKLRSRH